VGDWIGLFRARQRVDVCDGFLLTREAAGRMSLDARSGMAVGKVRLRTPRGVGTYDFRYFKARAEGDDTALLPLVGGLAFAPCIASDAAPWCRPARRPWWWRCRALRCSRPWSLWRTTSRT
jgi:hypothetical protein